MSELPPKSLAALVAAAGIATAAPYGEIRIRIAPRELPWAMIRTADPCLTITDQPRGR